MGCGGSKQVQPTVEANTGTQTRQKTAARPSGTARQHSSARKPSSHHDSRSGHPPSSRNRTSGTRHRPANRPQTRLTPLDEQPEDVAISDAVRGLAAIIEGHSRNYYPRTNALAVGKEIGQSIVNCAIMGDDNVVGITDQISDKLQRYQPYDSADREAHLQSLVEEGRHIRDTIAQHRGKWSFGSWDDGVKFPSLHKNGVLVTPPRH